MASSYNTTDASRPASILNLLAGIWLAISPWVLRFTDMGAVTWSTCLSGIAVIILAVIRLTTTGTQPLSWINCLIGLWVLISPFVLQFSNYTTPMWNAVILGILVALFGAWAALGTSLTDRYGTTNRTFPS